MTEKRKIIIDTDPGKDDVLAIMLASLSERFDILAITTVAGNCDIQNATNNAGFVIDLLGKKIPLYSGEQKPLTRELVIGNVMGKKGLDGAAVEKQQLLSNDAGAQIREIVRSNPNQVTIVAIGPQTNIANALQCDPDIEPLIQEIVMMAGSIDVPGNKNRVAEFNVFVDPEAADIVLRSTVPKTMIPLDVCYQVPIYLQEFEAIRSSKFGETIYQLMLPYIQAMARYEGQRGAIMYDALAIYYLMNPAAFTMIPMDIQIETKGDLTRGMCVVERRKYIEKKENVHVAMSVIGEMFKGDFLQMLKRG